MEFNIRRTVVRFFQTAKKLPIRSRGMISPYPSLSACPKSGEDRRKEIKSIFRVRLGQTMPGIETIDGEKVGRREARRRQKCEETLLDEIKIRVEKEKPSGKYEREVEERE